MGELTKRRNLAISSRGEGLTPMCFSLVGESTFSLPEETRGTPYVLSGGVKIREVVTFLFASEPCRESERLELELVEL